MAVFPDKIVLKNSTDTQATIESLIGPGGTDEIDPGELVVGRESGIVRLYSVDSNGDIVTISGGGGGAALPYYSDGYLDENSTASTSQVINVPTHVDGDLLIAAVMWRSDGYPVIAPAGWTLYGEYLTAVGGGLSTGGYQAIQVYTKIANSEPASYTWTGGSTRNAGAMFATAYGRIKTVTETVKTSADSNPFNVATDGRYLNLILHTWIYSSATSETATLDGAGVTQLPFAGTTERRMSAGWTNEGGLVSCDHSGNDAYANSNGAIVIQLEPIAKVGGGSIDDLTDVDTSTSAPSDGQALVWDNGSGQWVPGNVATGGGGLAYWGGGDFDTGVSDGEPADGGSFD